MPTSCRVFFQILPTLKFCAERDETVAIQLCVLGCYDAIAKRLEKLGPVATHILPACTPMLACKGLNSTQFEMAVGIIQGMLETVIAYRREQIANPSSTAILENKPTHAGGVPDEEEISRRRAIALGGWKPAPAKSSTLAAASKVDSPTAIFPGAAKSSSPAPAAAASSGGFDMADIFSVPPPSSTGSTGAYSATFSGNLSPMSNNSAVPVAAASANLGGNNGASSAADLFSGLSFSQKGGEATTNGTSGGLSDPFASAGFGDALGASRMAGGTGGGMSWIGGGGGVSSSGVGSPNQASRGNLSSPSMGGFSGFGAAPGGISHPPPPVPAAAGPVANGASAGDPFSAFFDAAIAEGSGGGASSPQLAASASRHMPASSGAGGAAPPVFMGGFGAGPVAATNANGGGGGDGGGESLEDQLAKTQREIAQLTRDLGGAGASMIAGFAAGNGMAAGMGAAGGGGLAMPSASPPPGGSMGGMGLQGWPGGGGVSSQQIPAQHQGQGAASNDPFAFLQDKQQGGAGSGFGFF